MKIFGGKKSQNFSKAKSISYRSNKQLKIMFCHMLAVDLVGVKIWYAHVKALGMRMRKLVLGLCLAQIRNKTLSPNKLGFIDVNRTVYSLLCQQAKHCSFNQRFSCLTISLLYSKFLFSLSLENVPYYVKLDEGTHIPKLN